MSTQLIKKHKTLPFLNAGTADAPDWVQIKKATEFTHSLNPETEERDYIADEQPTTELMQYKPSMSLSVTTIAGERDFDLFYSLYKNKKTGEDAKMEYLIVYVFDSTEAGGTSYYFAYKTEATVTVDEFNSVDSTITATIYENGTPSKGYVYLEDGAPVFTEGDLPEAEEEQAEAVADTRPVQVQDAYGAYSLSDSIKEELAAEFLSAEALAEAGLSYEAQLNSLELEMASAQRLSLKAAIGYGYASAHYPRDYVCSVEGKYAFVAGKEAGRISAVSLDYSTLAASGTYTGAHNDIGTCSGDDSAKRSAGEEVSDDMGTGAGSKLLAVMRKMAQALAERYVKAGLSYADGALSLEGEQVASR